ncbi:hypothetical protein Tco_0538527 [Tanacetum coccineum]
MTTLAKHMIVAGAKNRPPMLDKSMYNSWQIRIVLYIKGNKNGRMILKSIENGPLAAKDIWDRVNLLMKGTERSYQKRECKLYNEFDKFTLVKASLGEYKILNALQPEWSKFVTNVKLAKNLYTTNYDQLTSSSTTIPTCIPDPPQSYTTISSSNLNAYHTPPISQQPQAEFPQLDSGLAVPSFLPGEDPIAYLNKAMTFMLNIMASRFPSTNNQLRTSSNLRNQATIQDGMVTVQQVQRRQGQSFAGIGTKGNVTSFRGNNAAGQARAQEFGQVLDEDQLAFLVDPGIAESQVTQTTIPQNVAFQTDDLDAHDSDCDDISLAKAILMANLSSYDSDVLSEYLQEMQNAIVQGTHSSAQQDAMIMSVFEQSLIKPLNNKDALEILEFFKINEWQAKLNAKDVSIANLKKHIENLKGKNVVEKDVQSNNANFIAPGMFKLDL